VEETMAIPGCKQGLPQVDILTKGDSLVDAMRRVCGLGE